MISAFCLCIATYPTICIHAGTICNGLCNGRTHSIIHFEPDPLYTHKHTWYINYTLYIYIYTRERRNTGSVLTAVSEKSSYHWFIKSMPECVKRKSPANHQAPSRFQNRLTWCNTLDRRQFREKPNITEVTVEGIQTDTGHVLEMGGMKHDMESHINSLHNKKITDSGWLRVQPLNKGGISRTEDIRGQIKTG